MYRVVLSKAAQKDLDRLPKEVVEKVNGRFIALAANPRPPDVKKLNGRDAWRIRVGDYRVIYSIVDRDVLVVVVRVRHRCEVYR